MIPDLSSFSLKIVNQLRNGLSAFMFNVSSTVFERLHELDTFPGMTQSSENTFTLREHLRNRPHTSDCTVFMWRINSRQKRVYNAFRQKHGVDIFG